MVMAAMQPAGDGEPVLRWIGIKPPSGLPDISFAERATANASRQPRAATNRRQGPQTPSLYLVTPSNTDRCARLQPEPHLSVLGLRQGALYQLISISKRIAHDGTTFH